jgi:membrane protease YdiL (CAAX protease family)
MLAAITATMLTIRLEEHGRWILGIRIPPRTALRDMLLGCAAAAALIFAIDACVRLQLGFPITRGNGFPWLAMITTFIPAVIHEELLFRGYAYQKLRSRGVVVAILTSSVVFMLLHLHNDGVTLLGAINVLLGGVVLALMYELHRRMWLPFAFHLIWNVTTGPILGWPVGGYVASSSVFAVPPNAGAALLNGGAFGLQGSVVTTIAVTFAAAVLLRLHHRETRA